MKKLLIFVAVVALLSSCGGSGSQQQTTATTETVQKEPKKPAIEVIKIDVKRDGEYATVYAVVRNNTADKTASYINLKAFFYDGNGSTIGSGMGNAVGIEAGATKTIEIVSFDNVSTATKYNVEIDNVVW